ncbi:MAG: glycosyltransferase family 2 protein [Saprospiraceae bacterium]|nr:glycosyltransferase family 2 protein [Saprospiraceae bacterium]
MDFTTVDLQIGIATHDQNGLDLSAVYVVIPALNEAKRIGRVISSLHSCGFEHIVVVDDGSSDETATLSESMGTHVITHITNMGPGASTMTGITLALQLGAEYVATIDADHQSDPRDLLTLMVGIVQNEVDLLIGSRFLQQNTMPRRRIFYNLIGNLVSYVKTGLLVSDSQSGLKVMTRSFAERLNIDQNGFEFCIDIIKKARLGGAIVAEMPVGVTYTKETLAKGQSFRQGLMMLGRLLNPF